MSDTTRQEGEQLLTLAELAAMLGCCPETVLSRVGRGLLPGPRQMGARCRRWLRTEIEASLRALPPAHVGGGRKWK